MNRFLAAMGLAAGLAFAGTAWAGMIQGTLMKIDGPFYVVKDDKGMEHRIHYNESTKKEGEIKEGAKVAVDEAKGHANSIKAEAMKK
ncbi:MAG: hypothetical protein HY760_01815 [Nitrospirae bacterium]|nr:hypothetical protein [Nitrospirota bacterium]